MFKTVFTYTGNGFTNNAFIIGERVTIADAGLEGELGDIEQTALVTLYVFITDFFKCFSHSRNLSLRIKSAYFISTFFTCFRVSVFL